MMRPLFLLLALLWLSAPSRTALAEPPASLASLESYRLVFADEFDDPRSIGAGPEESPSAKWFRSAFFGFPTTPATMLRMSNGILTLAGTETQGANIQTAAPASNPLGWGGRVFREGGYFEARIALGPDRRGMRAHWPAFWAMAIEHMAQRGAARWPGQPEDFMRFAENDFFEYNPDWSTDWYIATVQEWYGRWQACAQGLWCNQSNTEDPRRYIRLPAGESWRQYHVYGQVWVPASARRPGYVQNYLDGRAVGPRVEWELGEPEPPTRGRMLFNVMDRQGLVLILTTGTQTMMVDWVRVWQLPTSVVERR